MRTREQYIVIKVIYLLRSVLYGSILIEKLGMYASNSRW